MPKNFLLLVLFIQVFPCMYESLAQITSIAAQPEIYMEGESTLTDEFYMELISDEAYWFGKYDLNPYWEVCTHCLGGAESEHVDVKLGWDLAKEYIAEEHATNFVGYGLYKIYHEDEDLYFYLDFRDNDFDLVYPIGSPDCKIKYMDNHSFEFSHGYPWNFRSITNGELIRIWEENGYSMPNVSEFPSSFLAKLSCINRIKLKSKISMGCSSNNESGFWI